MAELIIGFGKGKPLGKDAKSKPMGDAPSEEKDEGAEEEVNEFDAALDDAFDAVKGDDREAFKDALGAAIAAKCAEMTDDGDYAPKSEG
jgi:hypothetical protein